jgi:hypothetical protein
LGTENEQAHEKSPTFTRSFPLTRDHRARIILTVKDGKYVPAK